MNEQKPKKKRLRKRGKKGGLPSRKAACRGKIHKDEIISPVNPDQDLGLIKRAIHEEWVVPEKFRLGLVPEIQKIFEESPDQYLRLKAADVALKANAQNLKAKEIEMERARKPALINVSQSMIKVDWDAVGDDEENDPIEARINGAGLEGLEESLCAGQDLLAEGQVLPGTTGNNPVGGREP